MDLFSYDAVREEILNGLPVLTEASLDKLEVSDELYHKLLSWNASGKSCTSRTKYEIGDEITMKLGNYVSNVKAAPLYTHSLEIYGEIKDDEYEAH